MGEGAWGDLVGRSDADPLFMGWDWQWLWWRTHKLLFGATLMLVACYAGPRLVGLAPLFLRRATHRAGIWSTRLELIGSTWRNPRGVFSEYLDIIADREHAGAVAAVVADRIKADSRWGGLVLSNTPAGGVAAAMVRWHLTSGMFVREVEHLDAHRATLPGDFSAYVSRLNGSTRRRLWNHRAKLVDPLVVPGEASTIDSTLDLIDRFHGQRWGGPLFVGEAREFHAALAAALARRGELRMSTLLSGGAPIAAMYNVRIGGREYNIQSGFDHGATKGISPGYLHFGYCLEAACGDGIGEFDFLAGEGRHRQYKTDFQTTAYPLVTIQVLRAWHLQLLYRAYGAVADWRSGGISA